MISGYFDFDDYETPVKSYAEDLLSLDFHSQYTTTKIVDIQENEVFLSDSILFGQAYSESKFYSIGSLTERVYNPNVNPNEIVSLTFRLSKVSEQYERVVYSLLDMFGFLGGLFDFMFFLGYVIINNFQVRYF